MLKMGLILIGHNGFAYGVVPPVVKLAQQLLEVPRYAL